MGVATEGARRPRVSRPGSSRRARRRTWARRSLTLAGLVVLALLAGLQPWLPVEDGTPLPAPGPRVEAVTVDADAIHERGRCGPTVATVRARIEAPDGVAAVRLSVSKDGRRFAKGMVAAGEDYTSSLGPFDPGGAIVYVVSVTDRRGRTVRSAPGRLGVRPCP